MRTCVGCSQSIGLDDKGNAVGTVDGVVVDSQGEWWHPECRKVAIRQALPKRRGRPPKVVEVEDEMEVSA